MNEGAVCSQGSLASCRRCCARRARLTLNTVAWPATNICTEQLGTAWGHLGTGTVWGHLGTGTAGHCLKGHRRAAGAGKHRLSQSEGR